MSPRRNQSPFLKRHYLLMTGAPVCGVLDVKNGTRMLIETTCKCCRRKMAKMQIGGAA